MLPGRPYLLKIGTRTVSGDGHAAEVQGQRQHARAHGRRDARAQRDRRLQHRARSADPVRSLRPEPRHRRLHPDRPDVEQHGRRRHAALRAAPLAQHPPAARRHRQAGARVDQGPEAGRAVVHRALGRRQVDDREPARDEAARARPPHLPARRRQRAPRAQQGPRVHRRRPGREHPPHRRGREADGRRRADRADGVHLAVPLRAPAGAQPGRGRRVHRGPRRHTARRCGEPRRQGPLQEGARRPAAQLHRHRLAVRAAGERRDRHRHDRADGRRAPPTASSRCCARAASIG